MHKFNSQRKFGEASCYIYARINGRHALFTEEQVAVAVERARRQPEDVPKPSRSRRLPWWQWLILASIAYVTVASAVYRFRHPELSETQLLARLPAALLWQQ